jgi:adenylate kinase family enzyme
MATTLAYSQLPLRPRRIQIVGGPGSGKSTLARQLAAHLKMPSYDLDTIAFEGVDFVLRDIGERTADIGSIVAQPRWIAEGMWLGWTEALFESADLVIWLDNVPWHVAARRILTRQLGGALAEMKRQPGLRKFTRFRDYWRNLKLLAHALWSSRAYYQQSSGASSLPTEATAESRATTERVLAPYWHKVARCRNQHDIETVVKQLRS